MNTTALPRSRRATLAATTAGVAGVVALCAALWSLGSWPPSAAGDRGAVAAGNSAPDIDAMLATLAAKLAQRPGDAAGWRLLGRSYAALGRWGDSSAAYARASALQADDAQALADHADALAMAQGRSALGEPTRLIERALALDPRHPQALLFAATAALERNDLTAARAFTQRAEAAARDPTGSPH